MLPIPNPVAITIFGYEIRWYALTMITGLLAGIALAYYRRRRFGISEEEITDFILWAVPCAIIGARLYYVIFEWEFYRNQPLEILFIHHGGLAIHGALLAGVIVVIFYCRSKNINILKFLDYLAPSVALGQAIGRWGNYFNMEAHGVETDLWWAIPVREHGRIIHVHPTFLYESIWDLLVCILILVYENKYEKKCGEGVALYLIGYSIGRFLIEGLRTDSLMFFGLRQAQLLSALLIVFGIVLFIWARKHAAPFTE